MAVTATRLTPHFAAREFGATHVERRLHVLAEEQFEPTWDRERSEFAWGFELGESVPRGQLNATIMTAEVLTAGAWWRLFNRPNVSKFDEPTASGVDYPVLGIAQAWYDAERRRLAVTTYAADPARRGAPTRFRVTGLRALNGLRLERDGQPWHEWKPVGAGAIEISPPTAAHQLLISCSGGQA